MLKKIIKHSILILSAFCVGTSAWAGSPRQVTIALEGAYAPWNFTNPNGAIDGFEPALAKVLCERAKLDCKLIAADWDSMIPALNAGKFDVIMDALSITAERKKSKSWCHRSGQGSRVRVTRNMTGKPIPSDCFRRFIAPISCLTVNTRRTAASPYRAKG